MTDPREVQKGAIERLLNLVDTLSNDLHANVLALNRLRAEQEARNAQIQKRSTLNFVLGVVALLLAGALLVGGYFLVRTTSELHTQTHRIDAAQVRLDKVVKRLDCQERQDEARIHTSELFYIAERKKVVGQLAGLDDIGKGNRAAQVRGFLEFRQASQGYVAYVDRQLRALGIDPATGKRMPGAKPPAKC